MIFGRPGGPKGSQVSSKERFFRGFKTNEKTSQFRGGGLGTATEGLDLWGPGKTSLSQKSMAKHEGKRQSGNLAQTGAVRKGGL